MHVRHRRLTTTLRQRTVTALAIAAALLGGGCAGSPTIPEDVDRFERVNRAMYRFNRSVDRNVAIPVTRTYDRVMPDKVERRVRNFFTNLRAPIDIANNMLQGKFKAGFSDLGRFLFNSTAGIGGIFDPATRVGLERHPEDFGQTLAVWGVPEGPYFVLPLLGQRTLRDWGGWALDLRMDPVYRLDDTGDRAKMIAWRLVSDRAAWLPGEALLAGAYDEYVMVREGYLGSRRSDVHDDAPPDDDDFSYLDVD